MADEYHIPDMDMIMKNPAFFIQKYVDAGVTNARDQIMRLVNLYRRNLYCLKQISNSKSVVESALRQLRANKTKRRNPRRSFESRVQKYKRIGHAKKLIDIWQAVYVEPIYFTKHLSNLPPIIFEVSDIPAPDPRINDDYDKAIFLLKMGVIRRTMGKTLL